MIKNLIFDFGDIFLNLDKPAIYKHLERLGYSEVHPETHALAEAYETGQMGSREFLGILGEQYPTATSEQLVSAWNSILLDFPKYRLDFLENLKKGRQYRLFLLSNTNALHIDHVKKTMGAGNFEFFKNHFEGFYLSHEIKLRKPDPAIYTYVLKKNKLAPSDSLFIDDTEENTTAAAALGIQTWHLRVGQEDIIDLKTKIP